MKNNAQTLIISFFVVLLIQFFLLNNFQISSFIVPYLYLIFIVLFPLKFNKLFFLFIAFALGFIVDIFTYSYGIHAFTSVLIAYIRTPILKIFAHRAEWEFKELTFNSMGLTRFLVFCAMVIFIHHFMIFQLEALRFGGFFITIFKSLVSSFITLMFFLAHQFLTVKIK